MTRLDFIPEYVRTMNGLGEPPDPFDGMAGPLDNWWETAFTQGREAVEEPDDLVHFVTPEGLPEPEKVRSWDKQVKDILGPTGGAVRGREGGAPLAETDPGVFDLKGWQTTYENARIPVAALAKVAGTDFFMEPHAAAAMRSMLNAAKADGINLSIGNTYRDYEQQAGLYQAHLNGSHPAPVAAPGSSNHGWGLAADLASVGDAQFQWLLNHAQEFGFTNPWIEGKGDRDSVEPWHWEYQGGGDTGAPPTRKRKRNQPAEQGAPAPLLDLSGLADDDQPAFSAILASLLQPVAARTGGPTVNRPASARKGGSTTAQLRLGFVDAGRGDLAKMVGTRDFQTWINAESGGRVDAVSQYFPNHGRNYGLFQFAQIHPWTEKYLNGETSWTADAYTQAQLVARYFSHLTPGDIHRYAEQIRNGSYAGWG